MERPGVELATSWHVTRATLSYVTYRYGSDRSQSVRGLLQYCEVLIPAPSTLLFCVGLGRLVSLQWWYTCADDDGWRRDSVYFLV